MDAIRLLLLGAATWAAALGLMGLSMVAGLWAAGRLTPSKDRAGDFLFIAGGAITLVLIVAVIGITTAAINYRANG